jgi:hypothetical protein
MLLQAVNTPQEIMKKSVQTSQCTIQASYIRSFTEFCLRLKQEEKIKVV